MKGTQHATRYFSTNTAETAVLNMKKDLHVNMAYDDAAKRIVLDLTQDDGATAKQLVFDNVDMDAVLGASSRARLGVYSRVGGLQSKAIMSNLSWTGEAMTAALKPVKRRPALAFDRIDGLTSVTKTGDADLAFLKPDGLPTAVTLADGGLRFAKEPLETVTVGEGGGWIFSEPTGLYSATNGIRIGSNVSNNKDGTPSARTPSRSTCTTTRAATTWWDPTTAPQATTVCRNRLPWVGTPTREEPKTRWASGRGRKASASTWRSLP